MWAAKTRASSSALLENQQSTFLLASREEERAESIQCEQGPYGGICQAGGFFIVRLGADISMGLPAAVTEQSQDPSVARKEDVRFLEDGNCCSRSAIGEQDFSEESEKVWIVWFEFDSGLSSAESVAERVF